MITLGCTRFVSVVFFVSLLLLSSFPALAQYRPPEYPSERPSTEQPEILKEVRIDQKLDNQVPLDVEFRNENNEKVTLADYTGDRPVILNLVYFECPMLCNQILNGLTRSLRMLKEVPMVPGKDFEIVTISFDPRETPELAAEKKKNYLEQYDQPGAEDHWHWLTGEEENIKKITDAVGFHYTWDEKIEEYAHASAIFILTPDGKVSRYFFGIQYDTRTMRLGLTEASGGKIGGPVEKLMLMCYHYDPITGKYGVLVQRLLKVGGIIVLAALGTFMFFMFRQDRKNLSDVNNT